MGKIEDIVDLKKAGMSDETINEYYISQGMKPEEIQTLISQANIKYAVGSSPPEAEKQKLINKEKLSNKKEMDNNQPTQEYEEMQPSVMNQDKKVKEDYSPPAADYNSQQYQQPAQQDQFQQYSQYPQYQQYQQQSLNSDVITEISEQIVSDKINSLRETIEKVLDFKNIVETKIEYIDERLKRVEKVIDRLQLSVLQKVGEYGTNIEDIKNEMVETQKSFKSLLNQK